MHTRVENAADRVEIEALITETAWLLDARDWPAFAACYTTDAVIYYPYRGLELSPIEWTAHAEMTLSAYEATQHFVSNFRIDLQEHEAHVATCVLAQHAGAPARAGLLPDEAGRPYRQAPRVMVGAIWYDDLIRTDDGWRINRRHAEMQWADGDHVLRLPHESPFASASA
jgi:hypothetical protein